MLDYQRIVDHLRTCLTTITPDSIDILRMAVGDYAAACDEVNDRLRQCGTLLARGLRSEAIHLGETEPNVLDAVAALDFADRALLENAVDRYGMARPPELLLDVAAALNEAYALEQPLQALLHRHRLLSIGRSPLAMRLETLYALASADPENPVWREDVVTFEIERHKQIHEEVVDASQRGNLAQLEALETELGRTNWRQPPPSKLRELVGRNRQMVAQRLARATLVALEPQLCVAHAAFDLDAGRQLRDEWRKAMVVAQVAHDEPILRHAAPALEWLDAQDEMERRQGQQRQALAALEKALDRNVRVDELRRLHAAASNLGDGLPALLQQRYAVRLATLEGGRRRKMGVLIAAVLVACAALTIGIGALVNRQLRAAEVAQAAEQIHRYLAQKPVALIEGEKAVAALQAKSPELYQSGPVQEQIAELAAWRKKQDLADARLRAALAQAREQLAGNAPDVVRTALDNARDAMKSLVLADPAAETDLAKIDQELGRRQREAQAERNRRFEGKLEEVAKELAQLDDAKFADAAAKFEAIRVVRANLTATIDGAAGVSESLVAQAAPLRARLERVDSDTHRQADVMDAENRITVTIGDMAAFKQALLNYGKQFPDSPRKVDFAKVLEDAALWEEIGPWNELVGALQPARLSRVEPKQARVVAQQLKQQLGACRMLTAAAGLEKRIERIEDLGRRIDENGKPVVASLRLLLGDRLFTEARCIITKDGRHYPLSPPSEEQVGQSSRWTFDYPIGFDLTKGQRRRTVAADEIMKNLEQAPQVTLARQLSAMLDKLDANNWEQTFLAMADAVLAEPSSTNGSLDPLVKWRLLGDVLKTGVKGSACFERATADAIAALEQTKVDPFVNWVDPKDDDARKNRRLAEEELRGFPKIAAARQVIEAELADMGAVPNQSYLWIGWLIHQPGGAWQCAANAATVKGADGDLYALRREPGGKAAAMERIGAISEGKTTINAVGPALLEGRPVYLVRKS